MKDENKISEHTVKKFDLIEKYVDSWIQKLMNNDYCKEIAFIDCMCNSGIYEFDGNRVEGTPVRVARIIANAMPKYPNKKAALYFNDLDAQKIAELKNHLPPNTDNFQIHLSSEGGNNLLKGFKSKLNQQGLNYLLFYDPYKAEIDWEALKPYFSGWGEVILNHMVSDPLRALKQSTALKTKRKYENTYLTPFEELAISAGDRKDYEQRLLNIIKEFCRHLHKKYYVATIPFFIKTNALIYDLIFFTKHPKGFRTFKNSVWQTFGGKSSNQNTHGKENQLSLSFEMPPEEKDCYNISDIADYIVNAFKGRTAVPLEEIWQLLYEHPIFPGGVYRTQIKKELELTGRCNLHNNVADFIAR